MSPSLIGCARMYASRPSLSAAWSSLLARVSAVSGGDLAAASAGYPVPAYPELFRQT